MGGFPKLLAVKKALLALSVLLLVVAQTRAQERPQERRQAQVPVQAREMLSPAVEQACGMVEWEAYRSQMIGAPTGELTEALKSLVDALPGSPRTHQLIARAREIASEEPSENVWVAAAHSIEIENIRQEVAQDPEFSATVRALGRRFQQSLPAVVATPPPPFQRITVPGIPVRTTPGSTRAAAAAAAMTATVPNTYPWKALRPGDILLIGDFDGHRGGVEHYVYADVFSHAGIYLGNGVTYEAMSPSLGVRTGTLDYWRRSGKHIAIGRVGNRSDAQNAATASWIRNRFGDNGQTGYHILPPWDKWETWDGLYCSQLVWVAFSQTASIDLDSNNWRYMVWFMSENWYVRPDIAAAVCWAAVFPDEIRASDRIFWWYDGTNL